MTDPQPQQRDGLPDGTSVREALLPCPFCGCLPADLDFSEGSTFRWLSWSCPGCGIGEEVRVRTLGEGPTESRLAEAKVKAREWWNRRSPDAELAALREEVAGVRKALQPFVEFNSSEEFVVLLVRSSDIAAARTALDTAKDTL